jgi:hypothetical protein
MRDNDLIYISNAPATDLTKFIANIGTAVGTVSSTAGTVDVVTDISNSN